MSHYAMTTLSRWVIEAVFHPPLPLEDYSRREQPVPDLAWLGEHLLLHRANIRVEAARWIAVPFGKGNCAVVELILSRDDPWPACRVTLEYVVPPNPNSDVLEASLMGIQAVDDFGWAPDLEA